MPLDLIATLSELVATPSVNPMGREVSGPEYFEYRLTDYLERLFAKFSVPTWRQSIAPKRDNLLARLDGDPPLEQGGGLVLMEAHQDTVPVDGMTISPFDPQVRDGRLYGRGSCDIKGGMATMLAALARLADERPTPRPTVVMACTVNEEHGFTGATGLCDLWSGKSEKPNPLLSRRPDAAIVAEPTNLQVVVAHKGMIRWRCHTLGRAAHSSQPQQGENAVFRMARVLRALEQYQREVVGNLADHPLCGRPTLSVGTIHGGISVNTVPDRCTIEIDRRLSPGEDPKTAWQHVVDFVAKETALGKLIQHEPPFMQSRGLGDANNAALADRLTTAVQAVTGKPCRKIGVAFGTDAACFATAGVPCVVFGPGSIEQAHTAEEWVPLNEVQQAADVLYRVLAEWRGNGAK
jgi:acetylornithine deacetylase